MSTLAPREEKEGGDVVSAGGSPGGRKARPGLFFCKRTPLWAGRPGGDSPGHPGAGKGARPSGWRGETEVSGMARPIRDPKRRWRAILRLTERVELEADRTDSIPRLIRLALKLVRLEKLQRVALAAIPEEERYRMAHDEGDPWSRVNSLRRAVRREWRRLKPLDDVLDDEEQHWPDKLSAWWQAALARRRIRDLQDELRR